MKSLYDLIELLFGCYRTRNDGDFVLHDIKLILFLNSTLYHFSV